MRNPPVVMLIEIFKKLEYIGDSYFFLQQSVNKWIIQNFLNLTKKENPLMNIFVLATLYDFV